MVMLLQQSAHIWRYKYGERGALPIQISQETQPRFLFSLAGLDFQLLARWKSAVGRMPTQYHASRQSALGRFYRE